MQGIFPINQPIIQSQSIFASYFILLYWNSFLCAAAEFMRTHNMKQGGVIALCTDGIRLILRTDLGLDARVGTQPLVPAEISAKLAAPRQIQRPIMAAPKRKAVAAARGRVVEPKRRYVVSLLVYGRNNRDSAFYSY